MCVELPSCSSSSTTTRKTKRIFRQFVTQSVIDFDEREAKLKLHPKFIQSQTVHFVLIEDVHCSCPSSEQKDHKDNYHSPSRTDLLIVNILQYYGTQEQTTRRAQPVNGP